MWRNILLLALILTAHQSAISVPLRGGISSLQAVTNAAETKTIADTPVLIRVNIPGQGNDSSYYLLRIPLFLPHQKRAKSVKIRVYIETEGTDGLATFCPDFTVLSDSDHMLLERKLNANKKTAPEIISIFPVHQFLDAQFVHSKSSTITLSPSWAGASAGSGSGTFSKELSYSAKIPKCIGSFDKALHAVAWDYLQVKDQPILLGMINQYILIRLDASKAGSGITQSGIKLYEPKVSISPIVIFDGKLKSPFYSTAISVGRVESIEQFLKEHYGELSVEEQDLFSNLKDSQGDSKEAHYDLLLRKQD